MIALTPGAIARRFWAHKFLRLIMRFLSPSSRPPRARANSGEPLPRITKGAAHCEAYGSFLDAFSHDDLSPAVCCTWTSGGLGFAMDSAGSVKPAVALIQTRDDSIHLAQSTDSVRYTSEPDTGLGFRLAFNPAVGHWELFDWRDRVPCAALR
ncbi:MAG: hypothetical protein SGPRY_009805 [Prymnesium sp.]